MSATKRFLEDIMEEIHAEVIAESSKKIPPISVLDAISIINADTRNFKSVIADIISREGIEIEEIVSQVSEKLSPLYKFITDEQLTKINIQYAVRDHIELAMICTKLSGAVLTLPQDLHPIAISIAYSLVNSDDKFPQVVIDVKHDEDLKLIMTYEYKTATKATQHGTIVLLNPDKMI